MRFRRSHEALVAVATALTLIQQHPTMPAGMSHEEYLTQMQKEDALKKRGADAMGFNQEGRALDWFDPARAPPELKFRPTNAG
jgi:hypothetical protein